MTHCPTTGGQDVSIVLVTYNRERFLPRTLDDLLSQSYPHFELLICDDASSDGTQRVCEEYARKDSRIRYIRNAKNLGMPGNLNHGLKLARHELIANLHDGDLYEPTLIEKWREALLRHPSAGFVFNPYVHLAPDESVLGTTEKYPELMRGSDFLERVVFQDRDVQFVVWGTVMGRRSVYEEQGWFDPQFSFWSDMDMWCRIAEKYDVAHVPEPLIRLPSRVVMPHLFTERALTAHQYLFRIHWAARARHYSSSFFRRYAAQLEMSYYFVTGRAVKLFRKLVPQLMLRMIGRGRGCAGKKLSNAIGAPGIPEPAHTSQS